jgi:hypothetical protein
VKLPNGRQADLGAKLEDYVLNPLHREGKHKAPRSSPCWVSHSPMRMSSVTPCSITPRTLTKANGEATTVTVTCICFVFPLSTRTGTATVLSVWIVRHGESFPRLTTCYID